MATTTTATRPRSTDVIDQLTTEKGLCRKRGRAPSLVVQEAAGVAMRPDVGLWSISRRKASASPSFPSNSLACLRPFLENASTPDPRISCPSSRAAFCSSSRWRSSRAWRSASSFLSASTALRFVGILGVLSSSLIMPPCSILPCQQGCRKALFCAARWRPLHPRGWEWSWLTDRPW